MTTSNTDKKTSRPYLHPESTMDSLLLLRLYKVEWSLLTHPRLEVCQFVKEPFATPFVAVAVAHGSASDQAEVPVTKRGWVNTLRFWKSFRNQNSRVVRTKLVIGHIGVLEPFSVKHAYVLSGRFPTVHGFFVSQILCFCELTL